jgi:hypothetical protein
VAGRHPVSRLRDGRGAALAVRLAKALGVPLARRRRSLGDSSLQLLSTTDLEVELCHQQLGDHSEALQAYGRCRELLKHFLGVPPNKKTQALYHSVRERAAYVSVGSAL